MTKIFSYTMPIDTPLLDAYLALEGGFTDQFGYWAKDRPCRNIGLGRCIAIRSLSELEYVCEGPSDQPPILFSFNRFDAHNPQPTDPLFASFPKLHLMINEVVLIENAQGRFLQVNSLGPVYEGRVARFAKRVDGATTPEPRTIDYTLERDSREAWRATVDEALGQIRAGRLRKVVPARQLHLTAAEEFSAADLFVNLVRGSAIGTVFLYRYGDVFFVGATPELLVRRAGERVESMCLAGTTSAGASPAERDRLAAALLADPKNRAEHAYVVDYLREAFGRNCYDVRVDDAPHILSLAHVQHLCTPVSGRLLEGMSLLSLMRELHPTPALAGAPVGEAMMLIRALEPFNRGFFGGTAGYLDGSGDGEFSVTIRSGVFDGFEGYVYAGCGIVEGSDADAEYDEIDMKLKTILSAFSAPDEEARS